MAYEFRCRDNDHACRWKGRAATEEQLLADIADHARRKHAVKTTTETLASFFRAGMKQV